MLWLFRWRSLLKIRMLYGVCGVFVACGGEWLSIIAGMVEDYGQNG